MRKLESGGKPGVGGALTNDDYQKTDHDLLLRYQEDLNKVPRLNLNSPNGISSAACAAQPLFSVRYGTLHKPEYHDNEKYDQQ